MQKRHRAVRRGDKYPKRPVLATNDPAQSEAFYQATDADAPLGPRLYAAGVIQHPVTQLYQVWLSTNGLDVTCLSAHRDPKRADAAKQEVQALIKSGDLYHEEKVTELFQKLQQESDEMPSAFPDDLVRQITRAILRTVVDKPASPGQ